MIVPGGFLDGVDPDQFAAFLSAESLASISQFARRCPIAVHAHGLELRLAGGHGQVDYAVCLLDEDRTVRSVRAVLAGPRSDLFAAPYLRSFLRAWADDGSPLRERVPRLWLEFDRPDGAFTRPPGLFMALAPPVGPEGPGAALDRLLETLYAPAHAAAKSSLVGLIGAALPGGAALRHLGAAPSRRPDFMRLVVEGFDAHEVVPFLGRIGWPGDPNPVSQLLRQLEGETQARPAMIDLDVTDGLRGSLGFEFLLTSERRPPDGGDALLSFLAGRGWCSADKHAALRPMLGWTTRESPRAEPFALWQRLYHVKVTLKEAPTIADAWPVEAKAYWGVWSGPKARTLNELRAALRSFD